MCPLWPIHFLLSYILILVPLWVVSFRAVDAATNMMIKWNVTFNSSERMLTDLLMDETTEFELRFNKSELAGTNPVFIEVEIDDTDIINISPSSLEVNRTELENNKYPVFRVTTDLLGKTKLRFRRRSDADSDETVAISDDLEVKVYRESGALDKAFTYSVAVLVGIIYINMGAALDTSIVLKTMKKPIGPAIGVFSQFIIMPLLGYGLARWLIPKASLQLGLFITACSPGGGASNIWTLTLGGNLDLSITMTTISTFSAFFMMPLWIFTLGSTITEEADLTIPYQNIGTFAASLVGPLAIGIILQRLLPKVAKILVKILKPFAVFLILWIVVFAVYTNYYLFRLFTWEILVAGSLLPWLGYLLGGGLAFLLRQNAKDIIAIAIETGVQNTGLAIFALRFSLPQPEADLTTVLPVAVAIMTPIIPTIMLIVQKVRERFCFVKPDKEEYQDPNQSTSEVL